MPKYRKKPVVIDAEQWFPGKKVEGVVEKDHYVGTVLYHASVITLNGPVGITPGEWIITGIQGEKYPCADDIFQKTYEPYIEPIDLDEDLHPHDVSKEETQRIVRRDRPSP